jgi:hypothetical protein
MFDWVIYTIIVALICVTAMIMTFVSLIRETCNRLTKTNEQLMILISTQCGNDAGARALVASARMPQANFEGAVKQGKKGEKKQKEEEKPGVKMTMGLT